MSEISASITVKRLMWSCNYGQNIDAGRHKLLELSMYDLILFERIPNIVLNWFVWEYH